MIATATVRTARTPARAAVALAVVLLAVSAGPAAAKRVVKVPSRIDAGGRTDVTAKLRRFLQGVRSRTTVVFPPRAVYRIDGTLELHGRRGLTLDGNGTTLVARSRGDPNRSHVRLVDGRDWTIRDLAIEGANPHGGRFDPAYQWQHGFDLLGVDGATLRHVTVSDVFGDDIYVGLSPSGARWCEDVSIIDSTGRRSGRMAVAITAGRRITIDGGRWSSPGLSTFDVEPNGRPGGAADILIEHTTVGPGARNQALDVAGSGPISRVALRENRFTGRPLTVVVDQGQERPRDIVVEENTSVVTFSGPGPAAMIFHNTDGVTVARNRQALEPGANLALVATQGSTRVVVSGHPYRKLRSGRSVLPYAAGILAAAGLFVVAYRLAAR